ncbi:hypothetical protein AB0L41_45480 [Amycolatopsis mediterranei]|uniref:hypothetical protein n=1 Tax=Amycolatopsis mediterranei TaxID=33910 RepID=UPI003443A8F6
MRTVPGTCCRTSRPLSGHVAGAEVAQLRRERGRGWVAHRQAAPERRARALLPVSRPSCAWE